MITHAPGRSAEAPLSVRPEPVGAIRRLGLVPRRILMFGSGVLAGEGLTSHEAGLPGAVADQLAHRSRRGADVTVIVDPDPLSERARDGLRGLRLLRFDAVIVVLSPRSPTTPQRRWYRDLQKLAALLTLECAEHTPAFIYGSPSALSVRVDGPPARDPRSGSETSSAETGPGVAGVHFRELPPQPPALGSSPPFSPLTYENWAELIIDRLDLAIADLHTASPKARDLPSNREDDEVLRQLALQTLQLSAVEPDESLMFLLRQAKVAFATSGAALVTVESDQVRAYAAVGAAPPALPRDLAYSNMTIQSDRPTVISDAYLDPRVPVNPATGLPESTRFYAAYPIHTWDGYRIGALCIYDDQPRHVGILELVHLWKLAGEVEQHLWTKALHRGAGPGCAGRPASPREEQTAWRSTSRTWQTARRAISEARRLLNGRGAMK